MGFCVGCICVGDVGSSVYCINCCGVFWVGCCLNSVWDAMVCIGLHIARWGVRV